MMTYWSAAKTATAGDDCEAEDAEGWRALLVGECEHGNERQQVEGADNSRSAQRFYCIHCVRTVGTANVPWALLVEVDFDGRSVKANFFEKKNLLVRTPQLQD
jgi:hypothetical protein